jgi:hypothetical protein
MNIYTCKTSISIRLKCHTSFGTETSTFEVGEYYDASLEPRGISVDSNNKECILIWIVGLNPSYGCRFSVTGNIYHTGVPYWDHFTKYFECPVKESRDRKIDSLLVDN